MPDLPSPNFVVASPTKLVDQLRGKRLLLHLSRPPEPACIKIVIIGADVADFGPRFPNCKRVEIRYIHSTSWYSARSKSEPNSAAAAS